MEVYEDIVIIREVAYWNTGGIAGNHDYSLTQRHPQLINIVNLIDTVMAYA